MKTYDKLTKAEREKIQLYEQYFSNAWIKLWILFATGCIIFAGSIPLLLIFIDPMINLTGFIMTVFGTLIILASLQSFLVERKHLFLIFGIKDTFQDVFDITRSDVKKVKILREVKLNWKKEE